MTQPAKVQEPSMEEILASIRRIIADDEAKPPASDKPAAPVASAAPAKAEKPAAPPPAAKPSAMTDIPPSAMRAAAMAKAAAPPPAPPPEAAPPAPAASNNQDDIDALLSGLEEATSEEDIRPHQPDGEVLELTDEMAVPTAPPPQPSFRKVEPQDDLEFTETAAARAIQRQPVFEPPPVYETTPVAPSPAILSHTTVSAVESAFNTLAHTVLSNNARTLEDLVKEMLRPMLKSWLDDNLPGLVERIVKAEIERVSRGR
jgi:cell pole-organizing protein PopZ